MLRRGDSQNAFLIQLLVIAQRIKGRSHRKKVTEMNRKLTLSIALFVLVSVFVAATRSNIATVMRTYLVNSFVHYRNFPCDRYFSETASIGWSRSGTPCEPDNQVYTILPFGFLHFVAICTIVGLSVGLLPMAGNWPVLWKRGLGSRNEA